MQGWIWLGYPGRMLALSFVSPQVIGWLLNIVWPLLFIEGLERLFRHVVYGALWRAGIVETIQLLLSLACPKGSLEILFRSMAPVSHITFAIYMMMMWRFSLVRTTIIFGIHLIFHMWNVLPITIPESCLMWRTPRSADLYHGCGGPPLCSQQ